MVGLEQRLSAVVAVVVGGGAAGLGYRAVTHPLENIVAYQHRGEPLPDKSRISDELLSRQTQMPNRYRKCAPGILLAWSWPHGPFLCLTGAAGKSGQEGTGGSASSPPAGVRAGALPPPPAAHLPGGLLPRGAPPAVGAAPRAGLPDGDARHPHPGHPRLRAAGGPRLTPRPPHCTPSTPHCPNDLPQPLPSHKRERRATEFAVCWEYSRKGSRSLVPCSDQLITDCARRLGFCLLDLLWLGGCGPTQSRFSVEKSKVVGLWSAAARRGPAEPQYPCVDSGGGITALRPTEAVSWLNRGLPHHGGLAKRAFWLRRRQFQPNQWPMATQTPMNGHPHPSLHVRRQKSHG